MITFLISAIKIIFLLGFLIGIHETGHFLIAKLCKVRVNEFAIGFGPVIWKKQGKETKYELRVIPLGGFVNMEGEEERSDKEGSFSKASIPKRISIVAAGAIVNIVFAVLVYFILSTTAISNTSNVVAGIKDNFAAQSAGIQVGDKILKINNKKIVTSTDINNILNSDKEVSILIERDGKQQTLNVKPTENKYYSTGIYLQSLESKSTEIVAIEPESASEKQGLQVGDTIVKINEQEVKGNPEKVLEILQNSEVNEQETIRYKLLVERTGKEIEIDIIPEQKTNYYLGVELAMPADTLANRLYYAAYDTKEFVFSIVSNIKQLFTGDVSTTQLVGPVGISEVVAKTNGFKEFIYILAVISISLGVTNLLPFPPLDGGKIVLILIEAIRKRPLKQETELKIQMLGFALLIGISIMVTYNDILRII